MLDYSVGRSTFYVIMEFMDSEEELFPTQNCFLQEVLKRNFNTVCIIGEIRGDLESYLSDLQN